MSRLLPPVVALFLGVGSVAAQPQEWELLQNEPDPFCGSTVIRLAAPEMAEVRLEVWSPDQGSVVRVLVEGVLATGFHEILWDQRDDAGAVLPDGAYPYRLLAIDPDTQAKLFEAWRTARVACAPTPTDKTSWGLLKSRYVAER